MKVGGAVAFCGTATWLPHTRESAAAAIEAGRLDPDTADQLGYGEVPVAEHVAAPEMAVLAAREALLGAGRAGADVGLLVHAWSHYQGHDFWSPAHFVASRLGAYDALPVGMQQLCNGGATGIELAVAYLLADRRRGTALITTGDRFVEPGFDRWQGDYGVAYGDGATAAVLCRTAGTRRRLRVAGPPRLDLLAIATAAAPQFENMHRAPDRFAPAARWTSGRVDVRRQKKYVLGQTGIEPFREAERARLTDVVGRALAEAGLAGDDPRLRFAALPRLGRGVLESTYLPLLAELAPAARPLDLGTRTGHLGAGDLLANLAALREDDLLGPDEVALIVSAGGGFTWSCAVVGAPRG